MFVHDLGSNCILKAKVKASQRLNEKPHEAWVGWFSEGKWRHPHRTLQLYGRVGLHFSIASIYYTLFRKSETCSHVTAILFKLEACSGLSITKETCTSLPCMWNQTYSKKVISMTNVVEIFIHVFRLLQ